MANRRFIDFPIAASVGDNDIVLIWQDGLNKQTTKSTLFAGSPSTLASLTDVDISALTNGQILQYNSTTSKWENVDRTDIDLDQLGDVTIVSPTNGQVLVYNSSTSKWENSSGGFVPYTGAVTTVNLGAQSILAGTFVKAGGTSAQFLKADGSVDSNTYLTTGSAAATYVPYTGATADVNLGTHDLTAERGTFANNGSSDTLTVNHTSGSGIGVKVTKGGNNEALLVTKTSGSGNAMAVVGGRTALVDLSLSSVSNATGNFLTISGGVVHQRTPSETRSDVGAQAQLNGTGFVKASGTTITYDNSTYQVTSEKGQPNGYASLDGNGKVPLAQINDALIGNVNYQGLWNAATNNPTLVNPPSSGTIGYYYIVSTAGTFASISFEVGDWIISNGSAWQKVDNTDAVSSVFGRTGNVVAANGDYNTSQVTENTNLYYTEARVSANTDVAANTAARHNAVTLGTANGLSLSTQQLSLQLASGSQNGALSSTDWTTFNSKQQALNGTGFVKISGTTISYDNSTYLTTAAAASTYLALAGGTMTGQIVLTTGTGGGIRFPNDPFGGGSDTAGMRLISRGGEAMSLEIYTTNDADDWVNISVPSNDSAKVNGNTIWNAGNITPVPTSRTITINGTTQDLSDNRTYNVGTVTSVTASSPLFSSGGATPNITIQQASGSQNGFLSSTDWTTFNNKANSVVGGYLPLSGGTMTGVITTPNGTFGIIVGDDSRLADRNIANTLFLEGVQNNDRGYINFSETTGNALGSVNGGDLTWRGNVVWHAGNITPVPTSRTITINGTTQDLSDNRIYNVGTVTSVAALTLGTTGTDLSSSVANGTTTPVITLNVPTASASNRGALSAADWTTFNNKQNALTNPVTGTGTTNYLPKFTGASTIGNSALQEVSGNLGLGVAPSNWSLVKVLQIGSTSVGGFSNTGYLNANAFFNTSTNWTYVNSSFAARYELNSGDAGVHRWYTAPSGTAGNSISFTEAMTLNASGNLGLGVTPSAWASGYKALQFGNSSTETSAFFSNGVNNFWIVSNAYFDGTNFKRVATGTATGYEQVNGAHKWYQVASDSAGTNVSFTQAMTLDASGRLALGRISADHRLDVQGNILVRNTLGNASFYLAQESDNSSTFYQYNNGTLRTVISSNGNSYFNGGNVGIGVTPSQSSVGINKILDIGGASVPGIVLHSTNNSSEMAIGTGGDGLIISASGSANAANDNVIRFFTAASNSSFAISEKMRLFSDGNLLITTGSITNAGFKLDVNGTGRFSGQLTVNDGLNSTDGIKIIGSLSSSLFTSGIEFIRTTVAGGSKVQPLRDAAIGGVGFDFLVTANNTAEINATYTSALSILNTGAATFSSSVTIQSANTLKFNNSGNTGSGEIVCPGGGSLSLRAYNQEMIALIESDHIKFSTATVERMRITSGGDVLIGTTTPNSNKLRVNGNVWVDGNVAVNSLTCTSGEANTFINPIGSSGIIYSGASTTGIHQFLVNSAEQFAVTNTGIRTSAPTGGSVQNWKLGNAVNGTVNANRLIRVEIAGVGYDLVARQII